MNSITSLVAGPGAIGSLVGAHCQRFGPTFVYPHRDNLTLPTTLHSAQQRIALSWRKLDASQDEIDVIWICCKASHVETTAHTLLTQYPSAVAILLHNGMGPQEALTQRFGSRVIWGTTTCGALKMDAFTYSQTSHGTTSVGLPKGLTRPAAAKLLARLMSQPGTLNLQQSESMESVLWQKLLINAVINPLTAANQIPNGELLNPSFHAQITALCDEISALMQQLGLPAINDPVAVVKHVATLSAQNRSSMAEDIRLKRRSENEYINGYLIKKAKPFGLSVPHLKKWYKKIALMDECCQP